MPVTDTFMVKRALANHKTISGIKKYSVCQSLHCCKDCGVEFTVQNHSTNVDTVNASLAKNIYPTTTNVSYNHTSFLDEIAYDNAGQDEDLIGKADALYKQRLQKSRYIVWDIETFALNQQSGKGRQVPHLLVAATTCYNCLNRPFKKQVCDTCEGHHKTRECISNEGLEN